jgi:hypothetical protein
LHTAAAHTGFAGAAYQLTVQIQPAKAVAGEFFEQQVGQKYQLQRTREIVTRSARLRETDLFPARPARPACAHSPKSSC